MPKAPLTTKAETNGHKPKSRIGEQLRRARLNHKDRDAEDGVAESPHSPGDEGGGTDDIVIGLRDTNGGLVPLNGQRVKFATMRDAKKFVSKIKYLVRGWIPFGMITLIIAEPGAGKSAWVLYALARPIVKAPLRWFNNLKGLSGPQKVLWIDTENSMSITIDRIEKWGIGLDNIVLPFEDPLESADLTNAAHVERIRQVIHEQKPLLVVVDSLRGSHTEDENNSCVGLILKQLSKIAEDTGVAIVVIHHTRKLTEDGEVTANSSRGSNAILAMARSMLGIDRPDPDSEWTRIRMLKENLGLAPKPVAFRVTDRGVEFSTEVPSRPRKRTEKDDAVDWLREHMEAGKAYKAGDLFEAAMQDGHAERTVKRASCELKIEKSQTRKDGHIDGWEWLLPKQGAGQETGVFGGP